MNKEGKGFGFGINKMKQFAVALQKAQQMQEDAKKIQEELEQMEIQGESEGGLVLVVMSGNQEPLRVEISPEAIEKGPQELSSLVTAAMKDAYSKSKENMELRMEELTSSLNLPGM
ncbi:YbaB/EbfC family nucleoid-associated protein [Gloeocapsa sp. PCC 73106]|uniref:YbaB/EbfC family nucleoid-associated protein n=1 Tax=Gloeocapsa sp. PCC 73106 TaxID=102232 RepID=UPI0002ABC7FE|nr:YbaB/EbfC family nucleoid-associated protein [Gloeocapsa sp. PCC 73106]ELR98916.1 DNA-binding protein, YbaB/EbfC family [Gloeocapsa sp. PCC 73106]